MHHCEAWHGLDEFKDVTWVKKHDEIAYFDGIMKDGKLDLGIGLEIGIVFPWESYHGHGLLHHW